ncbi:Polypeptide-transport-associated domain protein FtsQ-type [Pseudonocardia dioxanivorans CB1190]|uniref:Polypeptide-transport-associated domain protein FtsQ-type n=1 Tax=Pseudonocardia dioxanivorans (strain ATCC 55486 / DSM 44775 / JCM 13855 / CB1190) TaxID=675635 RepID=F4CL79_PSEUX|nr:FtsQ-type POTRA domain-containing protein [Pseudonocardia dioxanivorans]AEA25008.1 Polypeptide-transport-associated domain protein FtsQ-type [Pseudonocardia dioxanivorans CB1190]
MKRPAAPGSAGERGGRDRRAGAGRTDAGQDTTRGTAADAGTTRGAAADRGANRGAAGGRGATRGAAAERGASADDGDVHHDVPTQPGHADRDVAGGSTAAARAAGDRTRAAAGRTAARRSAASATGSRPARGRTAHTDGRGRRIGAGGIAAIPGSSGGSSNLRPGRGDDPAVDPAGDRVDVGSPDPSDGSGTTATDSERVRRAVGTGSGAARIPARPRPVRPAPHILRRRRIALLVVVLVLLGGLATGVAYLLYGSGLADVEDVTVQGTLAVDRQQVLDAAAIPTGGPLVGVDTSDAEKRIAALPGVAAVSVDRDWPHTIAITVTERVAVMLADTPKGLMLVDKTGLPYEVAPEVPPALPRLDVGIAGTVAPGDVQTTAGLDVLAALSDAVRGQVQTITVTPPASTGAQPRIELALSDGRRVVWGTPDNGPRKAAVLAALLTEKGTVYDVASPDLPTIRR